jgi:hypothetical protein
MVGSLLKDCWPGLVTVDGVEELALRWKHYEASEDATYGTSANAVITRFWVSFLQSSKV